MFPSIASITFNRYWATASRDPLKPLCGADLQCKPSGSKFVHPLEVLKEVDYRQKLPACREEGIEKSVNCWLRKNSFRSLAKNSTSGKMNFAFAF